MYGAKRGDGVARTIVEDHGTICCINDLVIRLKAHVFWHNLWIQVSYVDKDVGYPLGSFVFGCFKQFHS